MAKLGDGLPKRWPKRYQPLWQDDAEAVYQKEKKEAEEKIEQEQEKKLISFNRDYWDVWKDSMVYGMGAIKLGVDVGSDKPKKKRNRKSRECAHEFRDYVGFTQAFQFCAHCDVKRDY